MHLFSLSSRSNIFFTLLFSSFFVSAVCAELTGNTFRYIQSDMQRKYDGIITSIDDGFFYSGGSFEAEGQVIRIFLACSCLGLFKTFKLENVRKCNVNNGKQFGLKSSDIAMIEFSARVFKGVWEGKLAETSLLFSCGFASGFLMDGTKLSASTDCFFHLLQVALPSLLFVGPEQSFIEVMAPTDGVCSQNVVDIEVSKQLLAAFSMFGIEASLLENARSFPPCVSKIVVSVNRLSTVLRPVQLRERGNIGDATVFLNYTSDFLEEALEAEALFKAHTILGFSPRFVTYTFFFIFFEFSSFLAQDRSSARKWQKLLDHCSRRLGRFLLVKRTFPRKSC